MTLYLGTWYIMESHRIQYMANFGSMSEEDDIDDLDNVELLGRWFDTNTGSGTFVCRSEKYEDIAKWLLNWVPMATYNIKPICDDNVAREIILGKNPDYLVHYENLKDEPMDEETIYKISYKFKQGKKVEGNKLFANLTQEQDINDSGNCRPIGRWHDLGNGSGIAIAAAKGEKDIYSWAFNWAEMCDCNIVPVLTDIQARRIISSRIASDEKLVNSSENDYNIIS